MLRKTLTILSLIGLLLSVGLWGACYWGIGYEGSHHMIALTGGGVYYAYFQYEWPSQGWFCDGLVVFRTHWWHFGYSRSASWIAFVPLWMPSGLFAVLLVLRLLPLLRRRKRKKLGLCVKCGYDLRASKERCPECGEAK